MSDSSTKVGNIWDDDPEAFYSTESEELLKKKIKKTTLVRVSQRNTGV